jgi:hypothetical protein
MAIEESCNAETYASIIAAVPAFVAVIVAVAVACISYQQYRLSKDKFRLDLFDKRFSIYKGTQRFLTHISTKAKVEMDKLFEFRGDTQDAIFLFGDEISEYLRSIDQKALDMWSRVEELRELPQGQERSRLCRENTNLLHALIKELPNLKDVFAPYLKFDKWK